MIEIDGLLINPAHVISAELDNRFYMNGSSTYLVIILLDGRRISKEHGYGFDAFKVYDALKRKDH
jgi:hypothetical protein